MPKGSKSLNFNLISTTGYYLVGTIQWIVFTNCQVHIMLEGKQNGRLNEIKLIYLRSHCKFQFRTILIETNKNDRRSWSLKTFAGLLNQMPRQAFAGYCDSSTTVGLCNEPFVALTQDLELVARIYAWYFDTHNITTSLLRYPKFEWFTSLKVRSKSLVKGILRFFQNPSIPARPVSGILPKNRKFKLIQKSLIDNLLNNLIKSWSKK